MPNEEVDSNTPCVGFSPSSNLSSSSAKVHLDHDKLLQVLSDLGCRNTSKFIKLCKVGKIPCVGRDQFVKIRNSRGISKSIADQIARSLETFRLRFANQLNIKRVTLDDLLMQSCSEPPIEATPAITHFSEEPIDQPNIGIPEIAPAPVQRLAEENSNGVVSFVPLGNHSLNGLFRVAMVPALGLVILATVFFTAKFIYRSFDFADNQLAALDQLRSRIHAVEFDSQDLKIDASRQQTLKVVGNATLESLEKTPDGDVQATLNFHAKYVRSWNALGRFYSITENKYPVGKVVCSYVWNGHEYIRRESALIPTEIEDVSSGDTQHDSNRLSLMALTKVL